MLCGSLDGRGEWGRRDSSICMTQFLCCPPETVTALSINYTPIQNKKLKKNEAAAFLIALCSPGEGATVDEMVEWHHQLNGHEFEQTPGDSEAQGSLACGSTWARKKLDTTE